MSVYDGRQPMGHDNRSAVTTDLFQGSLYVALRAGIQRWCGLQLQKPGYAASCCNTFKMFGLENIRLHSFP